MVENIYFHFFAVFLTSVSSGDQRMGYRCSREVIVMNDDINLNTTMILLVKIMVLWGMEEEMVRTMTSSKWFQGSDWAPS